MDRALVLASIIGAVLIVSSFARVVLRRRHAISRIRPEDFGGAVEGRLAVVFTSPYCHGCRLWLEELAARDVPIHTIDIAEHPASAARYRISATPRVMVVEATAGTVVSEFDHYTPRRHDLDAVERLFETSPRPTKN